MVSSTDGLRGPIRSATFIQYKDLVDAVLVHVHDLEDHYTYESGREGDACVVGFSSRKSEIVVYLAAEFASRESLLAELGSHKTGKACLYIKRLSDVSAKVLEKLVRDGFAHTRARYPV